MEGEKSKDIRKNMSYHESERMKQWWVISGNRSLSIGYVFFRTSSCLVFIIGVRFSLQM
jgi:hypothetical protein